MEPIGQGFDWINLAIALLAGFLLGRWSAGLGSPEAQAARKKAEVSAKITAQQRLGKLSRSARAEVERLAAEDRIIEAVKIVRTELGVDLKDAKDIVDHLREEMQNSRRMH